MKLRYIAANLAFVLAITLGSTSEEGAAQTVVDFTDGSPEVTAFSGLDPDSNPDPSVDLSGFNQQASVTGHNNNINFNLRGTVGRTTAGATTANTETNLNSSFGLGIKDANSSSNTAFRSGEELVFDFSTANNNKILVESLSFTGMTTLTRQFTLSSSDFDGRGYADIFNTAEISFDEGTDTFTFTNTAGGSNATFFLTSDQMVADSVSDLIVGVAALEDLTLGFSGDALNRQGRFAGFKVHAVPEPGSIGFLSACAFGFVLYRRRRQAKQEPEEESEA